MKKTLGVFGSAFDPIHLGHIDCIRQILGQYDLIAVVPSFDHAFGKQMADFDLRIKSVKRAIEEEFSQDENRIVVLDIERRIAANKQSEPIYTFDVLSALSKKFGTDDIEFVVGPDNAAPEQWSKFYRAEEVLTRWGLKAVNERTKIRSSMIRKMIANNDAWEAIEPLVPQTVLSDIKNNNPYSRSYSE